MDANEPQTYDSLASIVEYELLRPELSDDAIQEACHAAKSRGIQVVNVRPSDVDQALRATDGRVRVASTVDYPYGSASTGAKLYELRDLLRRGVRDITVVLNIGKSLSRQFQYVETELLQASKSCLEAGAMLTVRLGSRFLTDDVKIITCKIAKRVEAAWIGVENHSADYALLRPLLKDLIQMRAEGIQTLEHVFAARDGGCGRVSSPVATALLDEWKERLAREAAVAAQS